VVYADIFPLPRWDVQSLQQSSMPQMICLDPSTCVTFVHVAARQGFTKLVWPVKLASQFSIQNSKFKFQILQMVTGSKMSLFLFKIQILQFDEFKQVSRPVSLASRSFF
jgi:hypothetical protein